MGDDRGADTSDRQAMRWYRSVGGHSAGLREPLMPVAEQALSIHFLRRTFLPEARQRRPAMVP
jgi:hypothetical protein